MKKVPKYLFVIFLCLISFYLEAQTIYQITSDTRLRSGPGIKYKTLGLIKNGEKVTVKEKTSPFWFKIEYKGKIAFLSSKYIVAVLEVPTIEETSKVDEPPKVEIAKSNSTNPYIIIALVILGLLFVILSSRVKKKQSIKEKKLSAVYDSITPKQIFKEKPIAKETQSIKKEPATEITTNDKTDVLETNINQKGEDNNQNVLISLLIGAVENRTVRQVNNVEEFDPSGEGKDAIDLPKAELDKNSIISIDATILNVPPGFSFEKDPAISNLTLKEFRARIQELITALPNNKTKETIVNFHRLGLSYIDLAKARHELLALKEKDDIHTFFAFMNPSGEIIWAKMEHHTTLDLMIGQPLLRVDYYHNIIQLIKRIIMLSDHSIDQSSHVPKVNDKEEGFKPDPMEQNNIIGFTVMPNNGGIIDITEEKYTLPQYPQDNSTFNRPINSGYNFIAQYWGLGTKYKSKLRLNDNEVKILDSLIDTDNKFNSIEFIAIEIIRLFFDTVNHLIDEFVKMGTSLEEQTSLVAELELTQRYKLWKNSDSYLSQLQVFANSVNQVIYKICENSLREHFFIGRKTDLKYYIYSDDALTEFNTRFGTIIQAYIPHQLLEMKPCDDITEASLNEYNKSRWKNKLDLLKIECEVQDYDGFYKNVIELGNHNKNNPAVENIFFDASKFISKFNKEIALKLYVYYIYYDLQSSTFDNRKFAKAIQKSLFTNDQQLREFEAIINKLIEERKVDSAVDAVSTIYAPRRKKIQLDSTKIKEVLEKDSDTVELLNEYLKEENEEPVAPINIENQEEVNLVINYSNLKETTSIYKESNRLSEIQQETLDLFSKRGFTLSIIEFDTFVKSNGVFKNSLIESINDIYFELLDDILIEEDAEQINLNEAYYNKIIN